MSDNNINAIQKGIYQKIWQVQLKTFFLESTEWRRLRCIVREETTM